MAHILAECKMALTQVRYAGMTKSLEQETEQVPNQCETHTIIPFIFVREGEKGGRRLQFPPGRPNNLEARCGLERLKRSF